MKREIEYSFEKWCLDNNRQDILDRWDYLLNENIPSGISYKSNKKYWFKCPRGIHESRLSDIQYISSGRSKEIYCTKCRSFAQHIIDNFSEEYFDEIWHDNNIINPWHITYKSTKKATFVCQNNQKHIFDMSIEHYTNGHRCPYCSNRKIDSSNSLGSLYPKILPRWSDKNKKTPYDYSPSSSMEIWWKCENGIHEDFKRTIANSNTADFRCPKCSIKNKGRKIEDLIGNTYGELEVLYLDEARTKIEDKTYWICKCSCGAIKSISACHLKGLNTTTCGNKTIHYTGSNNANWKGLTSERQLARTNIFYDIWRNEVYKKDWYTCQCCGRSKNIQKQAHHFYNFSNNNEIRYDVKNGITLCKECHYPTVKGSFHNVYGTNNNTPEQLEEYINNKRKLLNIAIPFSYVDYINGKNILKPLI